MAFTPIATLKNTMENILEYVSRLGFLAEVRGPANNLRVTVTDGTVGISGNVQVSTVTTISTLSNQTSIGGYAANSQIPALQNMEATLANIDNIIIS